MGRRRLVRGLIRPHFERIEPLSNCPPKIRTTFLTGKRQRPDLFGDDAGAVRAVVFLNPEGERQ